MDPCCALKYYPDIELCVSEMTGEEKAKEKQYQKELEEDFGDSKLGRLRKSLWNLTEYPETSKAALMLGYCSLGLVIVSTITFVLGTFPGIFIVQKSILYFLLVVKVFCKTFHEGVVCEVCSNICSRRVKKSVKKYFSQKSELPCLSYQLLQLLELEHYCFRLLRNYFRFLVSSPESA